MAHRGADVDPRDAPSASLEVADEGAPAWRGPIRLGLAAACLIAAVLLLALPGRASKDATFFEDANIIGSVDVEEGARDELLAMIVDNNRTLPVMIRKVADLVKDGNYGAVATVATEVQKLLDQNERNMKLHYLVMQTADQLLAGNYNETEEMLSSVINDKCDALTKTNIADLKNELKKCLDEEDFDGVSRLVEELQPLERLCTEKEVSLEVIANESSTA